MKSQSAFVGQGTSRRRIIGAIAATGSSLLLSGANLTMADVPLAAAQASTPAAGAMIGRAGMPPWTFTVLTFQDPYGGTIQQPAQPAPGTRYVAAEVVMENASDQALNFTPADVRLRDASGREYRGGTAVGTEPFIAPRNLNGGERSRGWIWFTVPADAQVVQIVYVTPPAELRLALPGGG